MVVSKEHANSYNKIAEIPKNELLPVCLFEEISPPTKRTKNCVNLRDVARLLLGGAVGNSEGFFKY